MWMNLKKLKKPKPIELEGKGEDLPMYILNKYRDGPMNG